VSRSFEAGGGTASVSKTDEADLTIPPSQDLAIFETSYAFSALPIELASSLLDAESCFVRSFPPRKPVRALLPAFEGEATDME
jgi:hypothetical protein